MKHYISIRELPTYIPFTEATIRTYIANGVFRRITHVGGEGEYLKVGKKVVFIREKIDLWMEQRAGLIGSTYERISEAEKRGVPMAKG